MEINKNEAVYKVFKNLLSIHGRVHSELSQRLGFAQIVFFEICAN